MCVCVCKQPAAQTLYCKLKRREGECKEKERRKKGIKRKEEGALDAKGGKRK